MLFGDYLVILRGGGDLGTGAAYRLHKAGFPVMVFELAEPLVVRRRVALATAVIEGEIKIEDIRGVWVKDYQRGIEYARKGNIPVLIQPELPQPLDNGDRRAPSILIDGRMAKRNIDTNMHQAPLVIALGPGFTAGIDCHVVIETQRGHNLGRAIWSGQASPDTGTPGVIDGMGAERVLRSPTSGSVGWRFDIGQLVQGGIMLGEVEGQVITAPFRGVVRGLIAPGTVVRQGQKIGDIDPRGDVTACFTLSDKALSVGGGVLEAILDWLNKA